VSAYPAASVWHRRDHGFGNAFHLRQRKSCRKVAEKFQQAGCVSKLPPLHNCRIDQGCEVGLRKSVDVSSKPPVSDRQHELEIILAKLLGRAHGPTDLDKFAVLDSRGEPALRRFCQGAQKTAEGCRSAKSWQSLFTPSRILADRLTNGSWKVPRSKTNCAHAMNPPPAPPRRGASFHAPVAGPLLGAVQGWVHGKPPFLRHALGP
jgi:hypothetical protein